MQAPSVRRTGFALVVLATLASIGGCVHKFWVTEAHDVSLPTKDRRADAFQQIKTPLRAHLTDGSTVVYRQGATIQEGHIVGSGLAYPLLDDTHSTVRNRVPLDSVVGVETFEGKVLMAQSVTLSIAASALTGAATILLLKAVFGSCPTVYSDTGSGAVLQAEGFSYAIAPLLENRDVDPLNVRVDADDMIRLELRNEALETHFINHIELLAVRHARDAVVIPDQGAKLVTVGPATALVAAHDRAGRDIRAALAEADSQLFASAPATVNAAHAGDLDDWIDLEAGDLPAGDSIAVVLRLRNSLLNTVLLYDGILGGLDAADWMTGGLQNIGTALDVSRWYTRTMGMHATVDGVPLPTPAAREHARLSDVGPIAFRDVAIILPRARRDAKSVRVRLRFVADDWRIDRAVISGSVSRPTPATVHLARVVVPNPARGGPPVADTAALRALADADDRYLQTQPGQRMTLEFAAKPTAADSATSYLIAWQGWYREWIRGSWLADPARTTPWVPGDSAVSTALTRWRTKRDGLERAFYSSRIPVR
ncbi:MAG: hypothetical protein ABI664_06775 [bacterium]